MVFGTVSEAMELLIVFTVFILGVLFTHLLQRWSDRTAGEE
jgi:hypothetical protein